MNDKFQEYAMRTAKELLDLTKDQLSLEFTMTPEKKAELRELLCMEIHNLIVKDVITLVTEITKKVRIRIDFDAELPNKEASVN